MYDTTEPLPMFDLALTGWNFTYYAVIGLPVVEPLGRSKDQLYWQKQRIVNATRDSNEMSPKATLSSVHRDDSTS